MVPFGGSSSLELFLFSPQIFRFIQLEQFHASIGGSFMTFFLVGFHSPPNCNNFMLPFGGPYMDAFYFPILRLAQLQQFHGSVRRTPLMIFFFFFFPFPILHFTHLQQFQWAFVEEKEQKVDNRSDQVIL
jgi:hypothetical protein